MKNLKIALFQLPYYGKLELQKLNIEDKIKQLSKDIVLVVLPEMTLYEAEGEDVIEQNQETLHFLKTLSRKYRKVIIGNAIVATSIGAKNRAYVVYPNGLHTFYDKHQLFGKEQEKVVSGEKHLIIQLNGWKILIQICYDLRFPEWNRMNEQDYDAILFLAAWPKKRIHAWNILLQARAIENVSYVIGVNRTGGSYSGHSQVINPVGDIMVRNMEEDAVIEYELQYDALKKIRISHPYLATRERFLLLPSEDVFK